MVSEAEDFQQALAALESTPVDVAIVDISLKERSGIELIKEIRARHPDLPILVLSMHDESLHAEPAAGGSEGVHHETGGDRAGDERDSTSAAREVYLSERMASRMVNRLVAGRRTWAVRLSND